MAYPVSRTYRMAQAALLAVLVALAPLPHASAQQAKPAAREESPTEKLWNEAEKLLAEKKYEAALANFKKLEEQADKAGLSTEAKAAIVFRQASCLYLLAGRSKASADWAKLEQALTRFLTTYPGGTGALLDANNNMRGAARLTLIEAYGNQSKWDEALRDLETLRRPSPETREEDRVLAFVLTAKVLELRAKGRSPEELKQALGQAMNLLKSVISQGIGTPERREAANKLVEVYTALGMAKDAEQLRAEIEAKGVGSPAELVRANVQRLEIGDARFQAAEGQTDPKAREELYRQALGSYQGTLRRAALSRALTAAVESRQQEIDRLNRAFTTPDDAQKAQIEAAKAQYDEVARIQTEFSANKFYDAIISYRIGLCLLELNRPWEAFVAFRDIFQSNPDFDKISGAYYYYIDALRRIGRNEEALKVSKEFLGKFPESPEAGPIALGLGEICMEQEEYDQAIEQFNWAKTNVKGLDAGSLQEIDFGIIRALFSNVEWAKARTALEAFLQKYPTSPAKESATYMLGLTWFYEGKYPETVGNKDKPGALTTYFKDFPKGQHASDVLYRLGVVSLNIGTDTLYAQGVIESDQRGPDGALAIARLWLNRYGEAKDETTRIQLPEVHTLIGDAHIKKGDVAGRQAEDLDKQARMTAAPAAKAALMNKKREAEAVKEEQVKLAIAAYIQAARTARENNAALEFALGEATKLLSGRGDHLRLRELYQELHDWDPSAPKATVYLYEVIKATEKMGDSPEFRIRVERAQSEFGNRLATARKRIDTLEREGKFNTPELTTAKSELAQLSEELAKALAVIEAERQTAIQAARQEALGVLAKAIGTSINDRRQEGSERLISFLCEKLARRIKRVRPGQEPVPGAYNLKQAEADLETTLGVTESSGSLIAQARLYFARSQLALLGREPARAEAMLRRIADLYKPEELSPAILGTVGDFLLSKRDPRAESFFAYITEHHRSSDYADFGFAGLAELRLAQGKPREALVLCEEALALGIALSKEKDIRFAQARAQVELGQLDEARKAFTFISGVREWRGESTSGCLYHLGIIEEKQGKLQEALVLHQRNIVAWKKHERWVAKSYLAAGEILVKLGQRDAARTNYQEMLTKDRVKETPEAQEARSRLTRL